MNDYLGVNHYVSDQILAFCDFEAFPAGMRLFQDSVNRCSPSRTAVRGFRSGHPGDRNELVVKADVPDMEMKDIDVRMENGTLTFAGT